MEVKSGINIRQTGFSLLIEYTKAEILRVQETIKQAQIMENALNKSLQALQIVNISSVETLSTDNSSELDEKLQSLREPGYPYKGTKDEKVIFLLKKFNAATRVSDLADELMRIEGSNDGRVVSKSLHYKMNQMVADGKLVVAKWNKSKLIFYCLPEFFTNLEKGNVVLRDENLPKGDAWGKTPENERHFHKAKWIFFIKHN